MLGPPLNSNNIPLYEKVFLSRIKHKIVTKVKDQWFRSYSAYNVANKVSPNEANNDHLSLNYKI